MGVTMPICMLISWMPVKKPKNFLTPLAYGSNFLVMLIRSFILPNIGLLLCVLVFKQVAVITAFFQQFEMMVERHDLSVFQYGDPVALDDRAETVGDRDRGAVFGQA